jgi:hypothetical protein
MVNLAMKTAKVTAGIRPAAAAPGLRRDAIGLRDVLSSPLPEWRRARHVLDHCRAIHTVLTTSNPPNRRDEKTVTRTILDDLRT